MGDQISNDGTYFPLQLSEKVPDKAAHSSCQVQKVPVGDSKKFSTGSWVLLAFGHTLGIATQGCDREVPKPTIRVTTMAKALPIGIPRSFILPPKIPSLLPLLGLFGKVQQLVQKVFKELSFKL